MKIAKKHFVSADGLSKLLDLKASSYIGTLPKELLQCSSSPKCILGTLDRLALILRELNSDNLPEFKVKLGEQDVVCHEVKAGNYGRVFRLNVNDKSFAFKVFHNNSISDITETIAVPSRKGSVFSKPS